MNGLPLITLLTLTPALGAALIVGLDARQRSAARWLGLFFNALSLVFAILLWVNFNPASGELQFVERHEWIPTLNVQYFVGVDGLGLLMVMLAARIVPRWTRHRQTVEDEVVHVQFDPAAGEPIEGNGRHDAQQVRLVVLISLRP